MTEPGPDNPPEESTHESEHEKKVSQNVARLITRFVEVLDEEEATPGEACGAAAGVWMEAIDNVAPEDRHDVYLQIVESIKPMFN